MAGLEYLHLQPGEEDEALNFFYEIFVKDEGQLSSLGAGRNHQVTKDIKNILSQGISLVARSGDGTMVGQLLCEVHKREDAMDTGNAPSFHTLLDRYQDPTWARFFHIGAIHVFWAKDLFTEFPTLDKVFDLGFLSVARKERGKGIAGELFRRGEVQAKELGCQGMVVIASTTATVKLAKRLNMVGWREYAWSEYRDEDGRQVFNIPKENGEKLISFVKIF